MSRDEKPALMVWAPLSRMSVLDARPIDVGGWAFCFAIADDVASRCHSECGDVIVCDVS